MDERNIAMTEVANQVFEEHADVHDLLADLH
jgi:hypothetical protein